MHKYPIAIVSGVGLLLLISFSDKYQEKRKNSKFLDLVARYGNLCPYLLAMIVGLIVGELDMPGLEIGTFIKNSGIFQNVFGSQYLRCGNPAGLYVYQSTATGIGELCDRVW